MKCHKQLAILTFFFASLYTVTAQEKYSKVKIPVFSAQQKALLIQKLELDHFSTEVNNIICEIRESDLLKLKALSFKYSIVVDDISKQLMKINKEFDAVQRNAVPPAFDEARMAFDAPCKTVAQLISKPSAFNTDGAMGGYYNYNEMVAAMDNLVTAYPSLIQKFSLGKSIENRDIWCIKISDNVATDEVEPELLYSGLQHAREAITGTSLIFFMQFLLENYTSSAQVQSIVNNREIYIVPCVNPDGYVQNQTTNPSGGGMWRKNKSGADGTDLNRNYSVDWGRSGGGSSDPYNDTYWGTGAFSEPETQAMKTFITSRNFVVAIDQHCYGPYYSLPFGFSTPYTLSTDDQNFYSYIPALMGKYNCHRAGNSPQTVGYEVAGGIKDYFVLGDIGTGSKQKVLGMTGEAGGGGFWAPKAQIIPLSQGLCFQNLQIALSAGSYVDLQDKTDFDVSSLSGNFSYLIRRVGIGNEPVTVALLPIENLVNPATSITTSLNTYYETFTGNISYVLNPLITNGSRIRFAWKVETGGITTYDTIVKFYNPNLLLNDNMEGSLTGNWTVPSGGSPANKWGFVSGTSYAGAQSLTESVSGDYTASSTRYVDYKNTFDFSNATAAYLSFWVKHRAENCNDKLQVQLSTDGAVYTPVCGINTVAETSGTLSGLPALTGIRENWTREAFDLSNYAGNSSVRLRFEFTSNTDASSDDFYKKLDDGFYIDDVKVIKTTANLTSLPVTFINFTGKLLADQSVQLNWEPYTDEKHNYFEVEKSNDGRTFVSIGKINTNPPFLFNDPTPSFGSNLYKIKQVDKDGTVSYSKILNIIVANKYTLSIYPNPVKDIINIKVQVKKPEVLNILIRDLQGRILLNQFKTFQSGYAEAVIDIKSWKPEMYILQISNTNKELLVTQKILKV